MWREWLRIALACFLAIIFAFALLNAVRAWMLLETVLRPAS